MATAELAVAMPALAAVLVLALAGVVAMVDQVRCLDAARAAARAIARGDPRESALEQAAELAPDGAAFTVAMEPHRVRVLVSAAPPGPLEWIGEGARPHGSAVANLEETFEGRQ